MGYESGAIAVKDTNTGSYSYGGKEIYLSSTGGYVYGATAVYNTGYSDNNAQEVYRSSTGGAVYGAMEVYYVGCFPKSELVQVGGRSYRLIGSIKAGDKIRSWDARRDTNARKTEFTKVTAVKTYLVNEMICINHSLRISPTHPVLARDARAQEAERYIWKTAYDICIGDALIDEAGKLITVKSKTAQWHDAGIEVLNLETEGGAAFAVRDIIVRAENASDSLMWMDTPLSRRLGRGQSFHSKLTA